MDSFLQVVRVKHVFALILATLIGYSFINLVQYRIVPIWVLHEPTHQLLTPYSHTTSCSTPHFLISTLEPSSDSTGSILIFYRLPSLSDLDVITRALRSGEKSLAHRITPIANLRLPNYTVLSTKAECVKDGLITAVFSYINSTNTHAIFLYDRHFNFSWGQNISNIPTEAIEASIFIYPEDTFGTHRNVLYLVLTAQQNDFLSIWALSLKDGRILWNFLSSDPGKISQPMNISFSEKYWKDALLDYYEAHEHVDEVPWHLYQTNLVQILPMQWYDRKDTWLTPIKVAPHNTDRSKQPTHVNNNALVCIHAKGMILLDPTSGKTIARLEQEFQSGSTYAFLPTIKEMGHFAHTLGPIQLQNIRLNSVRVRTNQQSFGADLDEVNKSSPQEEEEEESEPNYNDLSNTIDCRGVAQPMQLDILPAPSTIYRGLCRPHSWFEFSRFGNPEWKEDTSKSVPPLVIRSLFPNNALINFWNHLFPSLVVNSLDYNPLHVPKDRHDLIFLTSDGSLTSLSNEGYENWRVNSEVSWLQLSRVFSPTMDDQSSSDSLRLSYRDVFRPSLTLFEILPMQQQLLSNKLKELQPVSALLTVGWDSMTLVSRDTGQLLATHKLPIHPVGKPIPIWLRTPPRKDQSAVTAMWIIPCEGMFVAFTFVREFRLLAVTFSIISLFLTLVCLSFCFEYCP